MAQQAYPSAVPHSDSEDHRNNDLSNHAVTYHRFMLGVKWMAIHVAAIMVFLVLAFATGAGFFVGVIGGAVVVAIGAYAMGHGLSHSSEADNPH